MSNRLPRGTECKVYARTLGRHLQETQRVHKGIVLESNEDVLVLAENLNGRYDVLVIPHQIITKIEAFVDSNKAENPDKCDPPKPSDKLRMLREAVKKSVDEVYGDGAFTVNSVEVLFMCETLHDCINSRFGGLSEALKSAIKLQREEKSA